MPDKSFIRLKILRAILLSLMITLVGRLFYIQISTGENFLQASQRNAFREVYTPSVRGLILDQVGRPVVSNESTVVVSVNTRILEKDYLSQDPRFPSVAFNQPGVSSDFIAND